MPNNIHVYAICYNEEYLMPFFLQHYFFNVGVKEITIYDNYSTDGTENIILAFSKQYPDKKVNVIKYDSGNTIRDDMYIQIKNTCWQHSNAEWVVVCDMDEFLYFKNPVNETLRMLSDRNMDIVRCKGYEMVGDYIPVFTHYENPVRITELLPYGAARGEVHNKCLLFRSSVPYMNYGYGAHSAYNKGELYESEGDILMLHYKFISLPYLIDAYAARAKRLSDFNKQHGFGFHYNYTPEQITAEYNQFYNKRIKVL